MTAERTGLGLDRANRFIGGVCAGFARYLDMPIWVIRLLTVFAAFTFALTIVIYIVLYFVLDAKRNYTEQQRRSGLIDRLRRFEWRRPLFKNKKRGKIQGVCTGIADYLQINPLIVRLLLLGSLFFGPLGILLYIGAAVVMEDGSAQSLRDSVNEPSGSDAKSDTNKSGLSDPLGHTSNRGGKDGTPRGDQKMQNPREHIDEIAVRFEELEQRLRQIEATITSRKFQLQRELRRMSASG